MIQHDLIDHIAQVDQGYASTYLFKIKHFMTLLVTPPAPFVNNAVNQMDLVRELMSVKGKEELVT